MKALVRNCPVYHRGKQLHVDVVVEIDVEAIGGYFAPRVIANKSGKTKQLHGLAVITKLNVREVS